MDTGSVYHKLFHAAEHGIPSDVAELIDKTVDVNVRDNCGRTPLIVAIVNHHPDTAIKLIQAPNANINLTDHDDGYTPLMLAIQNNMPEVYKMLIDKGCNVQLQNKLNETALHIAAKTCDSFIVQVINYESEKPFDDPRIKQATERTKELLTLLISHGCDVNVRNKSNQIALHLTSRMRTCTKYLLECGSLVNAKDKYNRTPLMYAKENGPDEVVEVLETNASTN